MQHRLLVEIEMRAMMVAVMMMAMAMFYHHNLRLRRIGRREGHCETEEKNQSEPEFFHTLL